MDGTEKGAILLMTIGEEAASSVLKHLAPKEVQRLGIAMAKMTDLPSEQVEEVLREFRERAEAQASIILDPDNYIRNVLNMALGNDTAKHLLDRILGGSDTAGIEALKWMDAATVADLVRNEHPQIIATILVHLESDQASEVLKQFTDRLRNNVVLRIATLDGVQPLALKELNDTLAKLMSGGGANIKKSKMGGVRATADILNNIGAALENTVLDAVREYDEELAQSIIDEMFTFDNLLEIDDRSFQLILREVQSDSLVIALKGTTEAIREKVFKNMSQRAADILREDLETRGPVKVSEAETEQKEILRTVRRLAEEGTISLGGGDEQFV